MAMVAGKKPTAFTPYLAQRRDGALSLTIGSSTRHWPDPFASVKSRLLLKMLCGLGARGICEMVYDGGGRFIPDGIVDVHTLSLLLSSRVANDRATEDNHTQESKQDSQEQVKELGTTRGYST